VYMTYWKTKNAWLLCLKGQTGAHSRPLHQGPWKASYTSGCVWRQWPTLLYSSLALRPHCLTEVGLGALLSRLPWRGAI